ncbi:MAG: hypothetical protein ACK56F_16095, partial [bacterium]
MKAHLAALAAAEPPEVGLHEMENLPSIELAGGEADAAKKIAAPGRDRSPTPRPGTERENEFGGGSPRPGAGERRVCPMRECQGSATHPLDECENFRNLSVTQREGMVRNWNRCECCLTDCRDKRTGSRCYRRTRFRRHHLLRLVPQAEASPAGDKMRQQQRPRRRAAKGDQTIPQGKPNQGDARHDQGQAILPQRQTDKWNLPVFSKNGEMVWLKATRSQHAGVTRITHLAAMRLGLAQSATEAYQIQLRLCSDPRFVLRAEGVETLECVRSRSEQGSAKALQPDVIIGWQDWSKVQPFVASGRAVSGQTPPGATAPATKWHLRMNQK